MASGFPTLQPAFIFKIKVGEANPIGDLSTGSQFTHIEASTGTIKSLPGFTPEIDAEVVFGGDWLYIDADKSHARVNFKGVAKTKEGSSFSFNYTGVVTIIEDLGKVLAFDPDAKTMPFGSITSSHTFETGLAELKDLENATWVGNSRFVVSGDGLAIEHRVSRVVAKDPTKSEYFAIKGPLGEGDKGTACEGAAEDSDPLHGTSDYLESLRMMGNGTSVKPQLKRHYHSHHHGGARRLL